MATGPVVLECGGCGARLRTSDPARARGRTCPRCSAAIDPAVDQHLGLAPSFGPEQVPAPGRPGRPSAARVAVAGLAVLVAVGSTASLAVRGPSPGEDDPAPAVVAPGPSRGVVRDRGTTLEPPGDDPSVDPDAAEGPPELADPPGSGPARLAILEPQAPGRPAPLPVPPPSPSPLKSPAPAAPAPRPDADAPPPEKPKRVLVRDRRGNAVVAREHGTHQGRVAVVLPDGEIGWPDGLIVTDRPFVPLSIDQMRESLLGDPELAGFRVHQTAHYLVFYQGTEKFAQASAGLLERLHAGLTGALKRIGLPVRPAEFPLVAMIYASEAEFRASHRVPPEVQAFYDIHSNRIYFYEKSARDQGAPEVAALRRPQTVAHEGTHQILHNVGIQPRLSDWPLWLVEGLAEYCSPPKITKKGGVDWAGLGQPNPIHLATIRDLDDPLPDPVRGGPRAAPAARDRGKPLVEYLVTQKELSPTDYALSWALTHYLAKNRLDEFVAYMKRMGELKPFEERSGEQQLATFREFFGADLAQVEAKVARHLKQFKSDDVLPYYAVIFEQQVGPNMVRRQAMVSQSPSVIRQWLDSMTAPEGAEPRWQAFPHPTRKRAIEAVEQWANPGR